MNSFFQKKDLTSWKCGVGVSVLSLVVLYGLVPYTFTYNSSEPISVFHMLWLFWWNVTDWQQGLLVFPISIGLIYWRRDIYKQIPVQGDNRAWILFLVGFLFYWIGYKGDIKPVAFLSIQILIAALVIWFWGWKMFKAALFPWAFLVFAWPIPGLDSFIAFPLREFMSGLTHHFLNIIGIPNIRSGTAVVSAPDFVLGIKQGERFALDVEDPCSGMRSLFALTMVTALYAYVTLPKTWQKLALFVCSIPLAVFGNFIRMLMLTFGTIILGSKIAVGEHDSPSFYHMFSGYMVFIAALGGMLGISWALQYDWKRFYAELKEWAKKPAATSTKP
jgi:exosortase